MAKKKSTRARYLIDNPETVKLFGLAPDSTYVGTREAMGFPPLFGCVNLIARTIAMLGVHAYARLPNGQKERIDDDEPVLALLKYEANPRTSAFTFIEFFVESLASRGNAIAQILRNNAGEIIGFYQIPTTEVTITQGPDGLLLYGVDTPGGHRDFQSRDVLHALWSSDDGLWGVDPVTRFCNTLAHGLALSKFHTDTLKDFGLPPGYWQSIDNLSPDGVRAFIKQWKEGARNNQKPVLLPGMEFKAVGFSPEVMQFVASKGLSTSDICMIYGVPAVYMGVASAGLSFASMEIQAQALATNAILPFVKRIETEINRKCFPKRDRFIEFDMATLLRPDTMTSYEAASKSLAGQAWQTVNEWRARFNLPPVEGGDVLMSPLNMASNPEPVVRDTLERSLKRLNLAVERKQGLSEFAKKELRVLAEAFTPIAMSFGCQDLGAITSLCEGLVKQSPETLRAELAGNTRAFVNVLKGGHRG